MTPAPAKAGYFRSGLPYNRFGRGPRTAVIFQGLVLENKPLTGLAAAGLTRMYRFLESDYTTYLITRRPGLPAGYTLREMAEDYAATIREEFGGPVDVIGTSTGGSIAQLFAANHPDLVRRLVLHSSAFTLGEAGRQVQRDLGRLARQRRWREATAVSLRLLWRRDNWLTDVIITLGAFFLSLNAPRNPSDFVITVEAEDAFQVRDRLSEITVPTLVVAGDDDPFYTPELFRETAAGIPNARLCLYPKMGHPASGKQFERDVLNFLLEDGERQMMPRHLSQTPTAIWQLTYRIGGLAALATVVVALTDIIISFRSKEPAFEPGRLSATDWFVRFRQSRFLALRDLGLWNIANTLLGIPLYVALFGAHRRVSPGPAAGAAALAAAGAVVYATNNRALQLLRLSKRFEAAGSDRERADLAAAGQAMLTRGEDFTPGSFPGFFLTELAGLVMGVTMLRSRVFDRPTAWSGLAGSGLLALYTTSVTFIPATFRRAMALAVGGGLLSLAWHLLTARRLFQLSRGRHAR